MANPGLDEAERTDLVGRLIAARRPVRDAQKAADGEAKAEAHRVVDGGQARAWGAGPRMVG